jgi:hypothetical protein
VEVVDTSGQLNSLQTRLYAVVPAEMPQVNEGRASECLHLQGHIMLPLGDGQGLTKALWTAS